MTPGLKVARRFLASYFNTGDVVLYGKWKNHHGKIVAFGQDKWGNPTIEIEPIPKGRKQNKVMNLFHIWRADVKENALKKLEINGEATMAVVNAYTKGKAKKVTMNSTKRVVARYIRTAGIERGRSVVVGDVRIHRFNDSFKIWDLTNAGKRGKKVDVLSLASTKGLTDQTLMDNIAQMLVGKTTFAAIKSYAKDLTKDSSDFEVYESSERGIDVNPGGVTKITLETQKGAIRITAEPLEFMVNHSQEHVGPKGNSFKQDTLYSSRDKRTAPLFYNWLKANLSEANKMDMADFRKLWNDLGIKYDYH